VPLGYGINGTKAWITNGGKASFYTLFARTSDDGGRGLSCFLAPGQLQGLSFGVAERKMGLAAVPTTTAHWDDAVITADRLIGLEGQGLAIALSSLDTGRLGIAAIAVGLAQSAMDTAITYAKERQTFGKRAGGLARPHHTTHFTECYFEARKWILRFRGRLTLNHAQRRWPPSPLLQLAAFFSGGAEGV
jgi:alkylation response protein AidB-like acyl-CoA dehydrogenase